MNPSHYDKLGVKRDAKPDEIKRAYRRKAEKLHPDKGGNHAEMAAVNRAYSTLIDPQKRLLYDQTGTDQLHSQDDMIRGVIAQAFSDALQRDVPDALAHARKVLENSVEVARKKVEELEATLNKFRKRRNKIKTTAEINIFHSLIDQQIAATEQNANGLRINLKTCEAALKILETYSTTEKTPPAQTAYVVWDISASTTGTTT